MRIFSRPVVAIIWLAFVGRFYRLADYPRGIFFDPAMNGLDAVRFIERGGLTLFLPTNGGRESLFIYLLVPFIKLFGTTPLSLRFLTATFGLLTIPLLWVFLKHQATPRPLPHLPLLASLTLAVSYWHIAVSRLGQRPIMVATLSVPVFGLFLKGWHSGQRRWFIGCGLVMGLGAYTYSAARLLPLILGLVIAPEMGRQIWQASRQSSARPQLRQSLLNLTLLGLTAGLTAAPMMAYFLSYPVQFTARAGSVMVWNFLTTPSDIVAELGRNIIRVATFFCCQGSPNPIFGLPDYPGLSPLLTPFLLLGLVIALRRVGDLFHRLIVLWWFIGLMPSIVAIEAPHPWRMIVALVPTAILVGLGLQFMIGYLPSRRGGLSLAVGLMVPLATLPGTVQAYFGDWTALQSTRGVYDYGAVAIHETILAHADESPIYLPFKRFNDSPLLFYLSGPFSRQAALTVPPADNSFLISPADYQQEAVWVRLFRHTATILPPMTLAGQQAIQQTFDQATGQSIRTADGETVARLVQAPFDPARFLQQPSQPLTATFGPLLLQGATYSTTLPAPPTNGQAGQFPVTLFWQVHQATGQEYDLLLHVVNDQRQAFGNGDSRPNDWGYPTSFWRPRQDQIATYQTINLTAELLPPGRYWLALAVFDPTTQRRLPVIAFQNDSPDTLFIGPLKVPLPTMLPSPAGPVIAQFGSVIELVDFTIQPTTLTAGESIEINLVWQARRPPSADYTVFIHLVDEQDNLVAGHDRQPQQGDYPTTIWSPGEYIPDYHMVTTPTDLPAGRYRLLIGLYHQPTGQRLPLVLPAGRLDEQGRFSLTDSVVIE